MNKALLVLIFRVGRVPGEIKMKLWVFVLLTGKSVFLYKNPFFGV